MSYIRITLLSVIALFLFGCASPAQVGNMKIDDSYTQEFDNKLVNAIRVSPVGGGEDTSPIWTSEIGNDEFEKALKLSLKTVQLLAVNNKATYELSTNIMDVQQPIAGLDMTVTTKIKYMLIDEKEQKILMSKTIVAPYTATFSDAFAGIKRLRLANEGSAKQNILEFLKTLSTLNMSESRVE